MDPDSNQLQQQQCSPACCSGISSAAKKMDHAPRKYVRGPAQDILSPIEVRELANAVAARLPVNYHFEIEKTVRRCRLTDVKRIGLQFPEGLLMFACTIADILVEFAQIEDVIVLGDVTYGACCVDDYTAAALEADLLVHYGHSCLVPVSMTKIPCLYVFVTIEIDVAHVVDTISAAFSPETRLAIAGTIQFESAINLVSESLENSFVPQCKPLSRGEVLGCTAPTISRESRDALVFIADGRFHLESIMMANPWLPAYRYDPYSKRMTIEVYDHDQMRKNRLSVVSKASSGEFWGIILGTLGRQGNVGIVSRIERLLRSRGIPYILVLLSEIFPNKLDLIPDVDTWVQVACPRLSVDWGAGFSKPLLSSYEAVQALSEGSSGYDGSHPMDYYSKSGGIWTNYYSDSNPKSAASSRESARQRVERALRAKSRLSKSTMISS